MTSVAALVRRRPISRAIVPRTILMLKYHVDGPLPDFN